MNPLARLRQAWLAGMILSLTVPAQQPDMRRFLRAFRERAATLFVNPDMNGDCLIDDQEAERGADETLKNLTELFRMVTERFDQDGDGRLSAAEAKRLDNLFAEYGRPRPRIFDFIDRDHNWNLDDEELEKARTLILARYKRQNEMLLDECDKNGDGKLEGDEIDAARQILDKRSSGKVRRPPFPGKRRGWKRFRR